jgi:hypothetical protein
MTLSRSPAVTRRTLVTLVAVLAGTSACGYADGADDVPRREHRAPREIQNRRSNNDGENEPDEKDDEGESEGENEPDENDNEGKNGGENEPDENDDENEPDENEPGENGSEDGGGEDEPDEPSGPGAGKCAENPGECEAGS